MALINQDKEKCTPTWKSNTFCYHPSAKSKTALESILAFLKESFFKKFLSTSGVSAKNLFSSSFRSSFCALKWKPLKKSIPGGQESLHENDGEESESSKKETSEGSTILLSLLLYPIFNGISNDLFSLNRYAVDSISASRDFGQVNRGSSRSLGYIEMTFYLFVED